jgi:uncharacterized protein YfbU (UPF0304 family)
MLQVVMEVSKRVDELQDEINSHLKMLNKNSRVVDVKFSCSDEYMHAMILYECVDSHKSET